MGHELYLKKYKDNIVYGNRVWFGLIYFIFLDLVPFVLIIIVNFKYSSYINISTEKKRELEHC